MKLMEYQIKNIKNLRKYSRDINNDDNNINFKQIRENYFERFII